LGHFRKEKIMKTHELALTVLLTVASGLAFAHHGRLQDHLLRGTILSYGIYGTGSGRFCSAPRTLRRPAGIGAEQTSIWRHIRERVSGFRERHRRAGRR
jgi:hypothetical protein